MFRRIMTIRGKYLGHGGEDLERCQMAGVKVISSWDMMILSGKIVFLGFAYAFYSALGWALGVRRNY